MRAAIYARISRDRVGAGLGVERQQGDCRALAATIGATVAAVYVDNDLSAYSGRPRPGYLALLGDVRGGRVDVVLVWHTDRLHRSPVELEEWITAAEAHGVAVHTVKAGPLDLATPSGRMVARQLGAVARYESEHRSERVRAQKAQAGAAGAWRGGRRPYGYEADGVTVRESEAAIVREATRRLLTGEALNSITRDLNDRGVTTSTGRPWKYTEVRRLILRHRNAGLVEHHGREVADAEWPAIVQRDTWRAARALLSDPSRKPPRVGYERFLGSGLFLCGVCGQTMLTATMQGAGRRRHPSYRCRGGPHLARMASAVDQFVTGVVVERLSRPDARLLLRPELAVDLDALYEREAALRGRLDELGTMFADGEIDGRQMAAASTRLREQLDEASATVAGAVAGSPLAGFADAEDVGAAWSSANVSQRKAVVRALMSVTLLKQPRGRQPGGGYFNPECVNIEWLT